VTVRLLDLREQKRSRREKEERDGRRERVREKQT